MRLLSFYLQPLLMLMFIVVGYYGFIFLPIVPLSSNAIYVLPLTLLICTLFSFSIILRSWRLNTPAVTVMCEFVFIILAYILNFSFLYYYLGLYQTHCLPSDATCPTSVIHNGAVSVYFSAITLTTVGYGDYIPSNSFCRLYAASEALLGYFLMATIIAIITKTMIERPAVLKPRSQDGQKS